MARSLASRFELPQFVFHHVHWQKMVKKGHNPKICKKVIIGINFYFDFFKHDFLSSRVLFKQTTGHYGGVEVAGVISAFLSTPLDVLRTRLNLREDHLCASLRPKKASQLLKEVGCRQLKHWSFDDGGKTRLEDVTNIISLYKKCCCCMSFFCISF